MKRLITLLLIVAFSATLYAQPSLNDGQYNVRFTLQSIDCASEEFHVDVEIQAASASTTFLIADQNYRFNFNDAAVSEITAPIEFPETNPNDESFFIESELSLSGFAAKDGTFSFFSPHTLTGSVSTIVSYNVALNGGSGYPIYEDVWTKVGRLRVKFIPNAIEDVRLTWHTHDPADFPNTYIGQKQNSILVETAEGSYQDFVFDPTDVCGFALPIELAYFRAEDRGCEVELEWQTETELNNDYFVIEKSLDGVDYRPLTTVDGSGTTNFPVTYNYFDKDVALDNYYRLIQYDFDGTSTASQAVHVQSSCFEETVVTGISDIFPNPYIEGKPVKINVYTNRTSEEAELTLTDIIGRVVYRQDVSLIEGANNLSVSLEHLSTGAYYVHLRGKDWISKPGKLLKLQ